MIPMIFRFSLYGFLKNQRYFEPFLLLLLLDKGFSFFLIGTLVAFREVTVNLLEVPSGAIADLCGRRLSMVLSFAAYIVCFVLLGAVDSVPLIFGAFFFFAVGDAFRTGTHKAMIFEWLRLRGRTADRTRVYGYTRSWSKLGSAVSGLLAALFVILSDSYTYIFFFATLPYALNIVNFLGYPKELDGSHRKAGSPGEVARHLFAAVAATVRVRPLRRLVGESMGWEGVFHAVKDYLQPVLQAAVFMLPLLAGDWSDKQRTALLIGPVYFVLSVLSAVASRQAHRVVRAAESEDAAARGLWLATGGVYLLLGWAAWRESFALLVFAFCSLHVLQNIWRPILVSRLDSHSHESQGATVLSIESQAHRLGTILVAPALGWAVDAVKLHGLGGEFWPIGVVGLAVSVAFLATGRGRTQPEAG